MSESQRLGIQNELENVIGDSGKVYYLPDTNVKLNYPCIVYELADEQYSRANNRVYGSLDYYDVTVIDRDPTCSIKDRLVRQFAGVRFDRRYVSDNLYHFVYRIPYRGDVNDTA